MSDKKTKWPSDTIELALDLHEKLKLNHLNWHQHKGDSNRRAAELLSSAMIQLVNDGELSDIEALINQSIKWLKKEVKDDGCGRK